MFNAGDFPVNHTNVCIPFDGFAAATGAPAAVTNFAAADVLIFKDGSDVERTSAAGITVTTGFNSITGSQMIVIDLSDNTDAGFYVAGHEYQVNVGPFTLDGQTVTFWAGTFSIERAGGALALLKTFQATLAKTVAAIGRGTVTTGSSTTSVTTSAFTPNGAVADQFKGRVVLFDADTSTTTLRGAVAIITASSNAANPTFTVSPALPATPASGDTFSVI